MDLDEWMLIHLELVQVKLGYARLEKPGKVGDHILPNSLTSSMHIFQKVKTEIN
jgi:hypothetical protein